MTTQTQTWKTATAPFAQVIVVVAGAVVRAVGNLGRVVKHRREAAMLAHFDDRMLADIGLTRSDVRDAFSVPTWRDPTSLLVSRVRERRRFGRNAPFGLGAAAFDAPSIVPDARSVERMPAAPIACTP